MCGRRALPSIDFADLVKGWLSHFLHGLDRASICRRSVTASMDGADQIDTERVTKPCRLAVGRAVGPQQVPSTRLFHSIRCERNSGNADCRQKVFGCDISKSWTDDGFRRNCSAFSLIFSGSTPVGTSGNLITTPSPISSTKSVITAKPSEPTA